MTTLFLSVLFSLCITASYSQDIEVRLVNGSYGSHMGRVEVLYNGTWGAVCNSGWNYPDGRVVCRSLGFRAVVCTLPRPVFGGYTNTTPVWMSNLRCRGRESSLDQCPFDGYEVEDCDQIGGEVLCASPYVVGATTDVVQLSETSITITIGFQAPPIPPGVERLRFLISDGASIRTFAYEVYNESAPANKQYQAEIFALTVNTTYSISVRTDVRYSFCSGWLYGNSSEIVTISTSESVPTSVLPTRLIPPLEGVDFMGRLEVMYNGTWGTVCDDYFGQPEANVVCRTLNFSRALCSVNRGQFGEGTGPIWLDNVDCSRSHEVLEDCDSNDWQEHNCQHDDDVGVICLPDAFSGSVQGLSVRSTRATTYTISWTPFDFPPGVYFSRYRIRYRGRGQRALTAIVQSSESMHTLSRLQLNLTYFIDIRAEYRFQFCNQFVFANFSNVINTTTAELAPSAPPTSFHVVVLNSTAIELQWGLPVDIHRNGIIRGYKLFIMQQGTTSEDLITVQDNSTTEYIITGLTANTAYVCSILAFTVADGPRTIHLTAITMEDDFVPFIIRFGINGDGFDRAVRWTNQTDVHVHCGSGIENVSISWFLPDGTLVSTTDRNTRQGVYSNGTNVLQIASHRLLNYCDAGVYTCVATTALGNIQKRNFTLQVTDTPPEPGVPYQVGAGTTWVTISWDDLDCDGGHNVTGFNIRYREESSEFIITSYTYIYSVDSMRENYTIFNLEVNTAYRVSIQALSAEYQSSSFSDENVVTTLPPAPSPPRHVNVRLVSQSQSVVEVRWREPALPNGMITHYNVYGFIMEDVDSSSASPALVERYNSTGLFGVANVTVPAASFTYVFQVSASNNVNGLENEGDLSEITVNSTVFIPIPDIEVRLVNGLYGSHMGRVEVLYNGTWGAVCNSGWNYPDGRVVCNSLGFRAVVCTLPRPVFGGYTNTTPVWMSNLRCRGRESSLYQCPFDGYGVEDCDHIGGEVLCASRYVVGAVVDVVQLSMSASTVTIGWRLPPIPAGVERLRFLIEDRRNNIRFFTYENYDQSALPDKQYQADILYLTVNTTYSVSVRIDIRYPFCSGWLYGNSSDIVTVSTSATVPTSVLPTRLIPPLEGVDFMGRLEIMYNDTWGTVCDDNFGQPEANVVCKTLNFSRALCSVNRGQFGEGTGPIWLDNVDCSRSHEVLEDCDSNDWGEHNCQHDDDVGVICLPDTYSGSVQGLSVPTTGASTVTISWNPFDFPPGVHFSQYRIRYRGRGQRAVTTIVQSSENMHTLSRLQVNLTYFIDIRAEYRFQFCNQFVVASFSNVINTTTAELAPSAPPTSFHVVVLNSTAIELQWGLPVDIHRNGIIRGYKLFIMQQGTTSEDVITVQDNSTTEYIITGLTTNTAYVCSILAFTVADGPRTIHLTAITMEDDFVPFIIRFGINGDGFDRAVRWTNQTDVHVHCGSGIENVSISWFLPDGTLVSTTDRNTRQGVYSNGTNVLQIASHRLLNYCDAGVYTCVATTALGNIQKRNFTLQVTDTPPEPGVPYQVGAGTTWVTISWDDLDCDGGHNVTGFNIRYREESSEFIITSYTYIYSVDSMRANYTIFNLEVNTAYRVSIQALSAEYQSSSFSDENVVTTLPPAPSPPRHVNVRLVSQSQSVVEVRWREPALPNGMITHYIVYGFRLLDSSRDPFSLSLPLSAHIVQKYNYSGPIEVVNITVSDHSFTYVFQVSASSNMNGFYNEGDLSEVTVNSTVFVPIPGLPIPPNVTISSSSNTSIVLQWDNPTQHTDPILSYKISYTGRILWRSPLGNLVIIDDSGILNTTNTKIAVDQLIPSTNYRFTVSVITERGEGEEVVRTRQTTDSTQGRVGYIQLLVLPVKNCLDWTNDASNRTSAIDSIITQQLIVNLCPKCGVDSKTIDDSRLSCREGYLNYVHYQARIRGSRNYSTSGFVSLLDEWIESGEAFVTLYSTRFFLSPQCTTVLDSPTASDCLRKLKVTTTTTPPITTTNGNIIPTSSKVVFGGPQIGGLIVGVVIALLLLVLVVVIVILVFRKYKHSYAKKEKEDETPFASNDVFSNMDVEELSEKQDLSSSDKNTAL